ncbi:hypothetical protein KY285_023833 [Solanum tuberosum]|nr:hypothetical protein KY289_024158 [Solanum tuberosum]KAH0676032.1 hypothetical protein KY285_023833 [Solanum tuberosum]
MDKSWLNIRNKVDQRYRDGVEGFLNWAFSQPRVNTMIQCPCKGCMNTMFKLKNDVRGDLLKKGFWDSYKVWDLYGEVLARVENSNVTHRDEVEDDSNEDDDITGMIHDACGYTNVENNTNSSEGNEDPNIHATNFYKLLKDAQTELYPGCTKVSKLSFTVKLLHLKCLNHWSNKSMDKLLIFFKEVLLDGSFVPTSFYEAKKDLRDLGLGYTKIAACQNDCILYWRDYANAQSCPKCGKSRWKSQEHKGKKVAHKILQHFPIKPRLQRLYMAKETSKKMRWHKEENIDDGVMRHPQRLHPIEDGDKILLPVACYALSPDEKFKLCDFLANLKVPNAFSSNISRCVNVLEKKIHGLKSHDHHVLLQDILPVAIRGLLPKEVCEQIIALGKIFKNLYSKCLTIKDLDILEAEIPIILCNLQMVFPPAFFDVMIHLPIHLAREAKLGGPVQYRDMYSIERYLRTLKSYIRNPSHPEGAIAEGHDDGLHFSHTILRVSQLRFQTKELVRKTQNSGVLVRGDDSDSNKEYYGVLEDIYELRYVGNRKVHLFKCHWWDVARLGRGYRIDKYSFTSVNTYCSLNTNEPFVLASQSEQVFYLKDILDKDWLVVVKTNPQDLFNMPEVEEAVMNEEAYQQEEVECNILCPNDHEPDIHVSLYRDDVEPQTVLRTNDQENEEDNFINDNHTDELVEDVDEVKVIVEEMVQEVDVEIFENVNVLAEQISSDPLQRTSPGTQSSRNLEESIHPSLDVEIAAVGAVIQVYINFDQNFRINRKRGRGKYKSKTVDIKTKYGGKIKVIIPDDIDRAVGSGARDIVNYAGLIMRSNISFQDGNWQNIVSKHGEAMWYKVKDKFEVSGGLRAHKLQGFVISTMQRLFRAWKARLHNHYCAYSMDEDRLSNRPEDVELEDWKYLVKYFGSEKFKVISERNKNNREKQITKHSCGTRSFAEVEEATRDPLSGEKDSPDKVWEIQHTRKSASGERVWLDPQSQQIHSHLEQLVVEQQSEEIENPMTRDEILSSILDDRSGYVRGKGYGKKPP